MSSLLETLAAELRAQVANHLSGTHGIDRDAIGPFLADELPKLEDYEIDLALSPDPLRRRHLGMQESMVLLITCATSQRGLTSSDRASGSHASRFARANVPQSGLGGVRHLANFPAPRRGCDSVASNRTRAKLRA